MSGTVGQIVDCFVNFYLTKVITDRYCVTVSGTRAATLECEVCGGDNYTVWPLTRTWATNEARIAGGKPP